MPLVYKFDVLRALKDKGYPTTVLRRDELLAESVIQHLRKGGSISWASFEKLCGLLECQPGDIIEYVKDQSALPHRARSKDDEFVYLYEIWNEKYRQPGQTLGDFHPEDYAQFLPVPDEWKPSKK